jgi:hypothetical protein
MFTLADGETLTLEKLEGYAKAGMTLGDYKNPCSDNRLAGYATIWDPKSTTRDRVLVNYGSTGLCLWDTKTRISHRWKHRGPQPDLLGERLKALMEKAKFAWEVRS